MSKCLICGEVRLGHQDQANHLFVAHPGPFKFWYVALAYETDQPSMQVSELKALVNAAPEYPLVHDLNGKNIFFSDSESVPLTDEPHFFCLIPATMYRGLPG